MNQMRQSADRKIFGLSADGGETRLFPAGEGSPVLKKKPGFFAVPHTVRELFNLLTVI
ncbi:Uncharacterized protein dnm_015020 [Desulfonema magnum]|uniref:Uncharacterized protein n=1 Tax=Desulfonema magnum TaxID=45655 RepID=A0A975BHJ5_9BACT|nr:Uncharacterized protein dnm_015020 [Desulfonema magnum]